MFSWAHRTAQKWTQHSIFSPAKSAKIGLALSAKAFPINPLEAHLRRQNKYQYILQYYRPSKSRCQRPAVRPGACYTHAAPVSHDCLHSIPGINSCHPPILFRASTLVIPQSCSNRRRNRHFSSSIFPSQVPTGFTVNEAPRQEWPNTKWHYTQHHYCTPNACACMWLNVIECDWMWLNAIECDVWRVLTAEVHPVFLLILLLTCRPACLILILILILITVNYWYQYTQHLK